MGQGGECPWGLEIVDFPDPMLEGVIRSALGKYEGDICTFDLIILWEIWGLNRGISDLSGLEHCKLLRYAHFDRNQVSDLSPLVGLTNLVELQLDRNQIFDLSPLVGLLKMGALDLHDNQISDISPLEGMTGFYYLDLSNSQIRDIYPLTENSGIDDGDDVDLRGNPLSSTSCDMYIPVLEGRGLNVHHDCP